MKITRLFNEFFNSEKAGGLIILLATVISLILANSAWASAYGSIWQFTLAGHPLVHWINDGLMSIFFLLIGLELKRELYVGELSQLKKASLPLIGALGGMLVPAGVFLLLNVGTTTIGGAGIPMATDIAFALAILSLLGKKIPLTLKVILTALAVIDDLGAILVIAFFYSTEIDLISLFGALFVFLLLLFFNRLKIKSLVPYLIGGLAMWLFMLNSGVHASITGVLLAFTIPFGAGSENSASSKLQHFLHQPVAFFILPVFAMANTVLAFSGDWSALTQPYAVGIVVGLVVGKPVGIFLFSWVAEKLGLTRLPDGIRWSQIFGVALLGGIGFTMSIFITLLAFTDAQIVDGAKMSILIASVVAGTTGYFFLKRVR